MLTEELDAVKARLSDLDAEPEPGSNEEEG
jgi:hypothetical protein